MAYDIPSVEPVAVEAGTSLIFTRDWPDYDPTLWTLTYELVSPTEAPITITAVTYESEYKVEVAHGVTSTWPAGEYLMSGYVTLTPPARTLGSCLERTDTQQSNRRRPP